MKYIIVDDEHFAHDVIKGYCELIQDMHLVQNCYDAIEALQCLKNNHVDLIFLDLNMPKLSGFEFLKTLPHPPKVIVTTAYKEYALEGYELDVVDYLLKPVSFERFLKAMNKVENLEIKHTGSIVSHVQESDRSIFLRSNKSYIQVELKNILFTESTGNYCKVVTLNEEIVIREKISDFIKLLPAQEFIQVHKSFIVSKNHIKSIEGNRIHLLNKEIPIGKHYKANVNQLLSGE